MPGVIQIIHPSYQTVNAYKIFISDLPVSC
jgi:hypothetical protein